jgi:hypothetical protein
MLWMWFKRHSHSQAVPNPSTCSTIRISTQKCMNRLSPYISMGIPQPPCGSGMRKCTAEAHAVATKRSLWLSHMQLLRLTYLCLRAFLHPLPAAFLTSTLFLNVCKANSQLHIQLLDIIMRNVWGLYHKYSQNPHSFPMWTVTKRGILSRNRV